jgi:hypothetical protein
MARKIIGYTFIIAAIFGLIFSAAGIVLVWNVRTPITNSLINTFDLISTTLEATSSGLTIMDETISNTRSNLTTLESTIENASKAIDDSVPMVETISDLLSGSLPNAIEATQTGISSLQDAAGTIESTLQLLTSIPLLPVERYAPEVLFSDALDDISASLAPIPQSLADMESTLNTTQVNLIMIAAQVRTISRQISDLNDSLVEIKSIIGQYQDVITVVLDKLDSAQKNIKTITLVTAWIFTIIFIWLGIAQVGLLTQGLERIDFRVGKEKELSAEQHHLEEIEKIDEEDTTEAVKMNDAIDEE